MTASARFPLSDAFLEKYRIHQMRHARMVPPGERLRRKRGHSQEFREYVPYIPGDDVRCIDWRASLRRGAPWEFLSRSFDSEEALQLVVSVDTSSSMRGPEGIAKLTVALWLAEALGRIALMGGDRLVLHRFQNAASGMDSVEWQGQMCAPFHTGAIRDLGIQLSRWQETTPAPTTFAELEPFLQPAAVWVIVSDFYFPSDRAEQLLSLCRFSQRRHCELVLIELDSWDCETQRLDNDTCLLDGPGVSFERDDPRFEMNGDLLTRVRRSIEENRHGFFRRAGQWTGSSWRWPVDDEEPVADMFQNWFAGDPVLSSLFRGSAWV